jgi:hypothetical protein
MALDEAIDRAMRAYDKDRLHPSPTEVVARNLGYKGINNGSALSALASLRYFGLLERPSDGTLAVTKDVETYKFAPDPVQKQAVLERFLKSPSLYADLLEKFPGGLPSDGNLRYDLIQRGFTAQTADMALAAFRRSVDFVGHFSTQRAVGAPASDPKPEIEEGAPASPANPAGLAQRPAPQPTLPTDTEDVLDRIPVRLPGGRRAWLLIPTPFFDGDKVRLKAQIDLLLTQDEEEGPEI